MGTHIKASATLKNKGKKTLCFGHVLAKRMLSKCYPNKNLNFSLSEAYERLAMGQKPDLEASYCQHTCPNNRANRKARENVLWLKALSWRWCG